jgi:hypothetical protein
MAPNIIDGMLEISLSLNPPPIKNGRKPALIPEITKSAAGTLSARARKNRLRRVLNARAFYSFLRMERVNRLERY